MRDPCDLNRFVVAQEPVFTTALNELGSGRKRTHWMWFIFPQLRGLGHSSTAEFYGIGSLNEARAYIAHPLLGPRLILCTEAVLGISDRSLQAIFGSPDDMKFRSSMTLFALAAGNPDSVFQRALIAIAAAAWTNGRSAFATRALLARADGIFHGTPREFWWSFAPVGSGTLC